MFIYFEGIIIWYLYKSSKIAHFFFIKYNLSCFINHVSYYTAILAICILKLQMKNWIKNNMQISFLNNTEALGYKYTKEEDRQTRTCFECLSDTNRLKTIIYTIPSQLNSCIENRITYSFALIQQINRPSNKRHLHLSRTSRLFGPKYIFLLRNHWDQRHPMRNPVWSRTIS